MINVKDFGAAGDGARLETEALQRAIDAGDRVLFPAGTYRTGTLKLHSNLTLHFEEGCRIVGSENIGDYIADTAKWAGSQHHYLFWGDAVDNVRLEGPGTIDGSGRAFWEDTFFNGKKFVEPFVYEIENHQILRPKHPRPTLLYFENSTNLTFTGIKLGNAAAYTLWCLGCEHVLIDGVTIRNPYYGPNTDALDIDCCRNVEIRHCDIMAGDDCVALKSDNCRLGRMQPCEDIHVHDCRFSSSTCGVRIGYEGDAPIRRVVMRNLEIYDTRQGLDIVSIAPGKQPFTEIITGTPISDILFENIRMHNVVQPIYFWAGNGNGVNTYAASICNIRVRNLEAGTVTASSYIGTREGTAIHEIELTDISIHMKREKPAEIVEIPSNWYSGNMKAVLNLRGIDGITLTNVNLSSDEPQLDTIGVSRLAYN